MKDQVLRPSAMIVDGKLVLLTSSVLLSSLGISLATIALPTLADEFGASLAHVQWVVLAYLLAVTTFIVTVGRLGDQFGFRPVFLVGLMVFVIGSGLCALSPTLNGLIAARAFQGLGGAILLAMPVALVRELVAKERTGFAIGLLGSMSAIGTALGPSLGGLLIQYLGWRWPFLLLAVVGLGLVILAAKIIPAKSQRQTQPTAQIDWIGMILLAFALVCLSLATSEGGRDFSLRQGVLIVMGLVGVWAFVLVERHVKDPLIRPGFFRSRTIVTALVGNFVVSMVMMSTLVLGPFYLTHVLGLSAAVVGQVMAIGPAMSALSGLPAGRLTDRWGSIRATKWGLAQLIVGLLGLVFLPDSYGLTGYIVALLLLTPGFQLFLAANTTHLMTIVTEDQKGVTSGLLGLSRNLGFISGTCVLGLCFSYWVGESPISSASPDKIRMAFSTTFAVATALVVIVLLGSWGNRKGTGG